MDGFGTGLLIGIVVVGVFLIFAALRKPSFDMAVNRSGVVTTALPPGDALARIEAAARGAGLTVVETDTAGHRLLLSKGASVFSWGHFVVVAAAPAAGGGATITVGLKTKVPQFGGVAGHHHRKAMDTVRGAVTAG